MTRKSAYEFRSKEAAAVNCLLAKITRKGQREQADRTMVVAYEMFNYGLIDVADMAELEARANAMCPPRPNQLSGFMKKMGKVAPQGYTRYGPRKQICSPDRAKSKARRERIDAQADLPQGMRVAYNTVAQRAVMTYVGWQIQQHGHCEDPYPKIASKTGTSETTVKTTMHQARLFGDVHIQERPRSGRKHLPNVITASSKRFREWLKFSTKSPALEGQNFDPDQVGSFRKKSLSLPRTRGEADAAANSSAASGFAIKNVGQMPGLDVSSLDPSNPLRKALEAFIATAIAKNTQSVARDVA